jgi:hypothetical protein
MTKMSIFNRINMNTLFAELTCKFFIFFFIVCIINVSMLVARTGFDQFWLESTTIRHKGGLGPESLRGNRVYKGYKDIAENASQSLKKPQFHLKMYLKSFAILEKVSISSLQNNWNLYKSPTFLNKSLYWSGNVFEMLLWKCV